MTFKETEHGYLSIANLHGGMEYRDSIEAMDDVAEWLGFADAYSYLDALVGEGSEIFRRAS